MNIIIYCAIFFRFFQVELGKKTFFNLQFRNDFLLFQLSKRDRNVLCINFEISLDCLIIKWRQIRAGASLVNSVFFLNIYVQYQFNVQFLPAIYEQVIPFISCCTIWPQRWSRNNNLTSWKFLQHFQSQCCVNHFL